MRGGGRRCGDRGGGVGGCGAGGGGGGDFDLRARLGLWGLVWLGAAAQTDLPIPRLVVDDLHLVAVLQRLENRHGGRVARVPAVGGEVDESALEAALRNHVDAFDISPAAGNHHLFHPTPSNVVEDAGDANADTLGRVAARCPWTRGSGRRGGRCGDRGGLVIGATAQAEHEVKCALLLDVVVREQLVVLELLSCENQALLVGRDTLLVLNLRFQALDRVRRLGIERDGFTSKSFDENLHFGNLCFEFFGMWCVCVCRCFFESRSTSIFLSLYTR